jgi:hypothetical protein
VVTSQAAKPGVAVLSPAVKPAAVVIAPTTTPLSEVNEPAVKPTAAVNPIIGNSPLIEQLPEPLALTPAPEQKPAASPYNPVLLLIEVSALVAIGITVIWLRKRTKNSTP